MGDSEGEGSEGQQGRGEDVSDIGYDAQDVEFRLIDKDTMEMRLQGDQVMKTTENGKYVKMPKVSVFKKNE